MEVKLSFCLTNSALRHKGIWGSGCIDPHFLDLGTSWRWVVNFTPRPLYPQGKSPRYPLDKRLGGPQSRSGRLGGGKILDPTETRTPTLPSSSPYPIAILTTLSRLLDEVQYQNIFQRDKVGGSKLDSLKGQGIFWVDELLLLLKNLPVPWN
jgi:hypothetical protein